MLDGIYNYLRLSDTIATAGQPSEQEIALIAENGFEIVINLGLSDADYALEDERAVVTTHGMEYIHIPVVWEQPQTLDLEHFFTAIEANQNKRLFIHCAANMRVSVFMALYRILRLGWSYEDAFEHVYRIWVPDETWKRFVDHVLDIEG